MKWTTLHDVYLCREILAIQPFQYKPRTKESGNAWQKLADDLNENTKRVLLFCINSKSVREHLNLLIGKHKSEKRKEENASGSSPLDTELKTALDDINAKSNVAKESYGNSKEEQDEIDKDRKNAQKIRQAAIERLAETKKRNKEEKEETGEETSSPKRGRYRQSGRETISYLREKTTLEMDMRKEELAVKKVELEQQKTLQQQQSTSTADFTATAGTT